MNKTNDQPWNRIVDPVEVPDNGPAGGVSITHPSYAQIQANRVSGGAMLYGSDFRHQHFVSIKIVPSEMRRSLSNDWPFAGLSPLIEIEMSEAQWAEFVSTMNGGGGTQCTLRYANGEHIPRLPAPEGTQARFEAEADEQVRKSREALDELDKLIAETPLSKAKQKELAWKVEVARRSIGGSAKFVRDQFTEHMERTVTKARIEINAYATHAVRQAGLDSLAGLSPISGGMLDSKP